MIEFLSSIDFTAFKIIGTLISALIGFIMTWVSKRSVNYRKIDKKVLLAAVLYFVYMNIFVIVVQFVAAIPLVLLNEFGIISFENIPLMMFLWIIVAVLIVAIYWGIIVRKSKRISAMMVRAKEISKPLFFLINGLSILSIFLAFITLPYLMLEQTNLFTQIMEYLNWIGTIWWFALMVSLVWRTAKYVFSEMKITMEDGEVIEYSCSPQMCRVHKHYVRLIERDEKGVIIYERHINESSIKQIEYLSETITSSSDAVDESLPRQT